MARKNKRVDFDKEFDKMSILDRSMFFVLCLALASFAVFMLNVFGLYI